MITSSPQFGTVAQVTIIPPFGPGVVINPDLTGVATQHRVDWQVSKGIGGSTPASCVIRVFNLGPEDRNRAAGITKRVIDFSNEFAFLDGRLIEGSDLGGTSTVSTANGFGTLKLRATYQGSSSAASLFEGTSTTVISEHRRDTWVTTITGGDGVLQTSSAIADKFWGSTVPAVEVLDYLVRQVMVAELATPYPVALSAYSFVGGYDATNFYASDILDQLTTLTKTEWWWDDGAVYFSDLGAPLPAPPIVLSPSGAPGTTRLLSKPRVLEGNLVEARALLLPDMRPKSPTTILAEELGGQYFASSIMHRGSNRSASVSTTTATLTPLGVVPFL